MVQRGGEQQERADGETHDGCVVQAGNTIGEAENTHRTDTRASAGLRFCFQNSPAMSDSKDIQPNPEKPREEWTTGDEPMTGPQMSYLKTLSHQAGVEFDETLTKAEASARIDELQKKTGRGK